MKKAGKRGGGEVGTPPAHKLSQQATARNRSTSHRAPSTNAKAHKLPRFPASPPAAEILARLKEAYPDARCALDHHNAFELLCATILSAQCTDARVNLVTPTLFARYPTAFDLAKAKLSEVQEIIKSTGFFRNKTRSLIGMAQALVADHGGEVPRTMEQLRKLPGVGRKTANVILGNAFGINEGVTVDTHVTRLSRLLGLSPEEDPAKIEEHLMQLFPPEDWGLLSHLLIFHGRQVCIARRPKCASCVLAQLCPSSLI